jgi:hypothetical protein
MAKLVSEDKDCVSDLQLLAKHRKELESEQLKEKQEWQKIDIMMRSGARQFMSEETADVMLCRAPHDEAADFIGKLEQMLDKKTNEVLFEPSEPSFEISLTRTARGGIKVEAWIDAGNGTTGIYTWDAAGVRFYSTDENLKAFVEELKKDFGLAD